MQCPACTREVIADGRRFCPWCAAFLLAPEIGTRASIWRRLGAWVIDYAAGSILWSILDSVLRPGLSGVEQGAILVLSLGVSVFAIWWLLILGNGLTPGKLVFGLQFVRADTGGRPGWLRGALGRELFGKTLSILTLGLGYAWALVDKDRRALHDLIAGTVVIRRARQPAAATARVGG